MSLLRAALNSVLSMYSGDSGTYCSVVPDEATSKYLVSCCEIADSLGFESTSALNLHVTLSYSKNTVSRSDQHTLWAKGFHGSTIFGATTSGFTHWAGHDSEGYLVLKLTSPLLSQFNKHLVDEYGLAGTFLEFNPHVTIATGVYGKDMYVQDLIQKLGELPTPNRLYFSGLRFENLDL